MLYLTSSSQEQEGHRNLHRSALKPSSKEIAEDFDLGIQCTQSPLHMRKCPPSPPRVHYFFLYFTEKESGSHPSTAEES